MRLNPMKSDKTVHVFSLINCAQTQVSVDVACTLMVRWSGCISHLNEACGNAGDTPSRVLLSTRVPSVPNCCYEAQRSKGGQSPSFARTCSSSIRRPSAPLPLPALSWVPDTPRERPQEEGAARSLSHPGSQSFTFSSFQGLSCNPF